MTGKKKITSPIPDRKSDSAGATGQEAFETGGYGRRFKRYTRRCEAEITAGDEERGIASDFSLNRLFLKTNYPMTPETLIPVALHLPDGSISYLMGKVQGP